MEPITKLLENSIAASLSAIEIYNKPNFTYRNEIFSILIINSWELLLKAKIIADNNGDMNSIYLYDNKGKLKLNRNESPLTIEIFGAMSALKIPHIVEVNIAGLIDVRDTAIHYVSNKPLDYLVYSLGAASLRNYQKCIKDWFHRDLLEYNFYIMPLGFSQAFTSFKMLDLDKEPTEIKRLIQMVSETQEKAVPQDGFVFTCDIEVRLVSAKKITSDTDMEVSIHPESKEVVIVERPQKLIDKYPISSGELWDELRQLIPNLKQTVFYKALNEKKVRQNEKFSSYNFRNKKQEENYKTSGKLAPGTPSLYNKDCVLFLKAELSKIVKESNLN